MRKRRRWPWIILGILFGIPCLLSSIGLVGLKVSFAKGAATLPSEIEAAKKAGIPVDPASLRRLASVADQDNAAVPLQRALGLYAQAKTIAPTKLTGALVYFIAGRANTKDEAAVRTEVEKLSLTLKATSDAAQMPGLDWHRAWERGYQILFSEDVDLKELSRWFAARSLIEARAGKTDDALTDIGTIFNIAHLVGMEPDVISFLIQGSLENIGNQALEQVLNVGNPSSAQLERAEKWSAGLKPLPDSRMALAGELVMYIQSLEKLDSAKALSDMEGGTSSSGMGAAMDWMLRDQSYRKAAEAKAIRYFRTAYVGLPKDANWRGMKSSMSGLDLDLEKDTSLENKINQMLMPVFSNLPDSYARELAQRRTMAESIAILKERKATGLLPATAPNLGVGSIDPFTSKPLHYKKLGTGFKVYCVDSDGVDDGGLTRLEDRTGKSKTHDLARTFK